MKIILISDTHGICNIKELLGNETADLLIHAGDLNANRPRDPWGMEKTIKQAVDDIYSLPGIRNKLIVAGNHETILDPKHWSYVESNEISRVIIEPTIKEVEGIKILVTPTAPEFFNWGFSEDHYGEQLIELSKTVESVDIIVSHSPPYGYGDRVNGENGELSEEHVGSLIINDLIKKLKPKFVVCGHIHEDRGEFLHENGLTKIINASMVDESYSKIHDPIIIEIEK